MDSAVICTALPKELMKLSKFPYLVQKWILDNMKCSDLFLLSFVSKNMKTIIKSSQAMRFKSIGRIVYDIENRNHQSIYIPYESNEDVILNCWDISEKLKNDYFQLNVSGKLLDFQCVACHCSIVAFSQWNKESVFESIHNYFLDFFGDTVKYQWIANNYMLYFPRLPNLSRILKFWSNGNDEENMKT
ncbi:unnamed protein product [Caenorhabditis nigoni]